VTEKFKTPIHVVLGYAGLLRKELTGHVDAGQMEDLGIIESQIGNILDMLEKSMEFAALDAENVPFEPEEHVARTLLDRMFKRLVPKHLADGVRFRAEHRVLSLDLRISADQTLLENMLRHVVDNAVRHTRKGSIELSAYVERGRLWVEVQDTGRGISPTELPQVFEPFFMGSEDGRGGPRLGLGLSIAQKYADLTGTNIEIFSRLNEGTRFVLCVGRLKEVDGAVSRTGKGLQETSDT